MKKGVAGWAFLRIVLIILVLTAGGCKNPLHELVLEDVAPKFPSIVLKLGLNIIANAEGVCNFGEVEVVSAKEMEIIIENPGDADLTLTGDPLVSIEGNDAADFQVLKTPNANIAAGTNSTFTLSFNPSSEGEKSATATIKNNADAGAFSFSLSGTATAVPLPEIQVKMGLTSISAGDTYSAKSTAVTIPKDVAFVIENTGTANLNLTGSPKVSITGTDASMFTVLSQPASPVVPSGYESFTVRFNPVSTGEKSVTIGIDNNDPDESSFSFTLTGTATAAPEPEIQVKQGSYRIPEDIASYDFGDVSADGDGGTTSTVVTFTIENTGSADLTIGGVTLSSGDTDHFDLTDNTVSPISPGGSTTFTVRFDPLTTGSKSATVSIANNDSDENPYTYNISGTGITTAVPSNFQASQGTSTNYVVLSWDVVPGATSYYIYRNTVQAQPDTEHMTAADSPVNDTSCDPGVLYYYWIRAYGVNGYSDFSTAVSGYRKLEAPALPSASDGTSSDYITLTWNATTGATSYELYRSENDTAPTDSSTPTIVDISSPPYNDTSASPAVYYYYWVRARASSSDSTSDWSSSNDQGYRQLSAPLIYSYGSNSNAQAYLWWHEVEGANAYNIYRKQNSEAYFSWLGCVNTTNYLDPVGEQADNWYYIIAIKGDPINPTFSSATSNTVHVRTDFGE